MTGKVLIVEQSDYEYQVYRSPLDYHTHARCSCGWSDSASEIDGQAALDVLRAALHDHLTTHGDGVNFLLDLACDFAGRPVEHRSAVRQAEQAGLFRPENIPALRDALRVVTGLD